MNQQLRSLSEEMALEFQRRLLEFKCASEVSKLKGVDYTGSDAYKIEIAGVFHIVVQVMDDLTTTLISSAPSTAGIVARDEMLFDLASPSYFEDVLGAVGESIIELTKLSASHTWSRRLCYLCGGKRNLEVYRIDYGIYFLCQHCSHDHT